MVPLKLPKKSFTSLIDTAYSFIRKTYARLFMLLLSYVLLQPHKFEVFALPESESGEHMDVVYENLIQTARQDTVNGDIEFEMLITLEGDDDTITYTVAPGDTLSEIAKLFGSTSNAIREANNLRVGEILRVGQKLKIAYDNSIIYDVPQTISVEDFAARYDVNIDDLLTLNYFEHGDDVLEEGQQIFVPLNRVEAEERGLVKKKDFVMLDLPKKTVENGQPLEWTLSGSEQPNNNIPPSPEQVIITAEQTQQHLERLEQARKESAIAETKAAELAKQAEEARLAQVEADKKAQSEAKAQEIEAARLAKIDAEKRAEAARLAKIDAEKKAEILKKAELEEKERKQAEAIAAENKKQQDILASCGESKCYHEGKCWTKPENAVCAPTDPDNAWVCKENFVDTGKACISQGAQAERAAQATGPKKDLDVVNQWYFNPYNDGYGGNGWAGGHCTLYVGWWLWKNKGVQTAWRGNAKYWYDNAAGAGWSVGQTPKVGSVIVMKYGAQGRNGYGHVGVVIDINWEARQVFIEDMNYVGRYVVSQHWVDMDSTANPVIGYIYP